MGAAPRMDGKLAREQRGLGAPPLALLAGVDPQKDAGHACPFWEGEKHRFAAVRGRPEAQMAVPTRSLRWKSDEHWNNPTNQFSMKVTQSLPRQRSSMSLTA